MEFGVDNEVLRSFQQEVRNYLPAIQETARSGGGADESQIGAVREMARTIGSAASMLGLADLHEAAGELERGLDGGDHSDDDAFLAALACLEQFGSGEFEPGEDAFDLSPSDLDLWPEQDEAPAPASVEEIDEILSDEMLEVYQAESEEHLALVFERLAELEQDLSRRDLVQEVRRSVHTLKGAAAMVGLRTAGALAKRAQDFLDQVCEGAIELTADVLKLLTDLAATLDGLARAGVPDDSLRARAGALRHEMGLLLERGAEDISRLAEAVSPMPPPAAEAREDEVVSGELFEIFQVEAEEQLEVVGQCLRTLEQEPWRRDVVQELRRAVHTLKGAAGMVGLTTASSLAHSAEDLLDQLYQGGVKPTAESLQLLFATADALQDLSRGGPPNEYLRNRANELKAAFGMLPAAEAELPQPIVEAAEPAEPVAAPQAEARDEIVSAEMLEVYQAESEENLSLIVRSLRRLESDPGSIELIQEVRRSVHTLKGAAGMVGLRTAGALAHRAEDYLDQVFERRRTFTPESFALLFETADALDDLARVGLPDEALCARAIALGDRFGAFLEAPAEAVPPAPSAVRQAAEVQAPVEPKAAPAPGPVAQPQPERAAKTPRQSRRAPAPKPPARVKESVPVLQPAAAATEIAPAAAADAAGAGQFVRVPVERVDELVRLVSELVVHRSTLEQQYSRYSRELGEHDLTTGRLRRLAVRLEDEFASRALLAVQSGPSLRRPSIAAQPAHSSAGEFDELELDRYSEFHLLSRDVTETASDLVSGGVQLRSVGEDFRQALHRFGRVTGQVQDLLMRMRMMQVGSIENRLHRTVRVAATRRNKSVRFQVHGAEVELDKTLLAEITGPLEHILRNAVDHGLESSADRVRRGKSDQGSVTLRASLDGHRAVLRISDDGRGLDPERIRTKAVELGRYSSAQVDEMSDAEVFELIFQPGFTTAEEVSEISGRGVGLDAVRAAVTKLGGSVSIESELGQGASFVIGLPTSLAVTRVLLVESAGRRFCIPAHAVDKVARGKITPPADGERRASVDVDGRRLPAYRLSDALHLASDPESSREQPILVVEAGERRYALAVDQVMEARDAVVKPLGPLLEGTPGISSATVLGDGSVALILNPVELPEAEARISAEIGARPAPEAGLHVLMADDSISVRRVLMKTLEAAGWRYTAARDGQDALERLRELDRPPDVALLDVEMPRMDGFQLTTALRAMPEYQNLPIVMLTSRAGEKHRRKAAELGANDYLVKPYIEDVLLGALRRAARAGRKAA